MPKAPANVHSRLLIAALLLWVVFLGFETVIRTWDLYQHFPLVDLPSHFLAGLAVTALAYWALIRRPSAHPKGWAVAISLLVGGLWEAIEAIQELFWPDEEAPWLADIFFWDGVTDMLAGLVGAMFTFAVLRLLKRSFKIFRPMDI